MNKSKQPRNNNRQKGLIRQYIRGYKNKPESIDEIKALQQLSFEALEKEIDWRPPVRENKSRQ